MVPSHRAGITSALTEVIIVGLAVALALSFAAWVVGHWSEQSRSAEGLTIFPDSYLLLDYRNNQVVAYIHVRSNIKPSISITTILLSSIRANDISIKELLSGENALIKDGTIIIPDGTEVWIEAKIPSSPNEIKVSYYNTVEVLIISDNGYLYKAELKVKIYS